MINDCRQVELSADYKSKEMIVVWLPIHLDIGAPITRFHGLTVF